MTMCFGGQSKTDAYSTPSLSGLELYKLNSKFMGMTRELINP